MRKLLIVLLAVNINYALSFDNNFSQYGIRSAIGYNFYPSSFTKLNNIPNCCPTFRDANGLSYGFGGIYEYYFDNLGIVSNITFNHFEGTFLQKEAELFSVNYEPVWGSFNHHLDFNITSLDIELGTKINIKRLTFGVSIISSIPISSNYKQFESISVPNGRIYFIDSNGVNTGKSTRNELKGKIPDLSSINFSPSFNFAYHIPLTQNEEYILKPEMAISYQINNFVSDLSWKRFNISLSLNLLLNNNKVRINEEEKDDKQTVNQDSIDAELDRIKKLEEEIAIQQYRRDSIAKANELNRLKLEKEQARLDSLERAKKLKEQQIAEERIAFNNMIEEQNRITGKKCKCFVIQFISTTNIKEYNKYKKLIKEFFTFKAIESEFIEPYQNVKYYRIQSDCFQNHLDAFDEKVKLNEHINNEDFLPQILCK